MYAYVTRFTVVVSSESEMEDLEVRTEALSLLEQGVGMMEIEFEADEDMAEMNRRYSMFSEAGNNACEAEVRLIVAEAEAGELTRKALRERYERALKAIAARGFEEVYDTEPHTQIAHEIDVRVCRPNMWTEFTRWGD